MEHFDSGQLRECMVCPKVTLKSQANCPKVSLKIYRWSIYTLLMVKALFHKLKNLTEFTFSKVVTTNEWYRFINYHLLFLICFYPFSYPVRLNACSFLPKTIYTSVSPLFFYIYIYKFMHLPLQRSIHVDPWLEIQLCIP